MINRILTACLILSATHQAAFAHPGGLNAEGCHNNRKTGEYHCHRSSTPSPRPAATARPTNDTAPQSLLATDAERSGSWSYRNCTEARAAGAAPVRIGEPGYGPHLDRDNDGIGCETSR
ncbi:MAG: excalibur calcium-binding domain-containing protein [Hyphomonas sp.]